MNGKGSVIVGKLPPPDTRSAVSCSVTFMGVRYMTFNPDVVALWKQHAGKRCRWSWQGNEFARLITSIEPKPKPTFIGPRRQRRPASYFPPKPTTPINMSEPEPTRPSEPSPAESTVTTLQVEAPAPAVTQPAPDQLAPPATAGPPVAASSAGAAATERWFPDAGERERRIDAIVAEVKRTSRPRRKFEEVEVLLTGVRCVLPPARRYSHLHVERRTLHVLVEGAINTHECFSDSVDVFNAWTKLAGHKVEIAWMPTGGRMKISSIREAR